MRADTKKIFIIVAGVLLLEVFAFYMAYSIYNTNKKEHLNDFKTRQLIIARQVKARVEDFFNDLSGDLHTLSMAPPIVSGDTAKINRVTNNFFNSMKDRVTSLRYINEKGILVRILPETKENNALLGKDYSSKEYFQKCLATGDKYISNSLTHENGKKEIHVSVPVFAIEEKGQIFKGIVTADVDLDWLTQNFLASVRPEKEGYIWMMDENGTLLSQIRHPEMVFNNIFTKDKRCYECHETLEPLKKILMGDGGIYRYEVKGSNENYIVSMPTNVASKKWVIAINTPVTQLDNANQKNFEQTLVLMFFIAATILLGSILILRINRERIVAENREKYTADILATKQVLEKLIENSADGILIVDEKGIMKDVNEAACNIIGYDKNELIGMHTAFLSSPDPEARQKRLDSLNELFTTGRLRSYENMWKRKNGEIFPCDSTNSLFKDENGDYKGGIVIFRDITEKKKLEQALIDAQRLSAVGQIGITVKHEINNPLGGIIGYCELMLKHPENYAEDNLRRLKDMLKMAFRIRDVIKKVEGIRDVETTDYIDGIKMIDIRKATDSAKPEEKK
ncbi:MAG: PAS domain S-box protein [Candidatus Schekmanbacteria bacterium]|nr:PAS domain S-box protein [Candidatus Schekmanbacteria bacterium]